MVLLPNVARAGQEQPLWARVTVLLEPDGKAIETRDSLIPGGTWSTSEAEELGMEAIDRRISERVERLAGTIQRLEETMRLGTLMVRQYYLQVQHGHSSQLPILDLDPRYRINLTMSELSQDAWGFVAEIELDEEEQLAVWHGDPISLTLRDADLHDILRTFSTLTGHKIICDPEIEGSATVDLRLVPWDQALDLVLRVNDLGYRYEGADIHVIPLASMPETGGSVELWTTEVRGRRAPGEQIIVAGPSSMAGQVVLVIEDAGPPAELEQLRAMPRVRKLQAITLDRDERAGLAIVRGTVTREGGFEQVKVLRSPSPELSRRIHELVTGWELERIFEGIVDKTIITREAVIGFGIRLTSSRVMTIPDHIGIDMEVRPGPDEGLFVMSFVVRDLDTGRVITQPRVTVKSGKPAKVQSGFVMPESGEHSIVIEALPDAAANTLTYTTRIIKGGRTISEHKASIQLWH
jgi:hypothetical protein